MSAVAPDSIAELADLVARSARVVVFSGAGISTESGIPDFRSPGGVWTRYDPTQLTFERYVDDPDVRRQSWQMRREFFDAAPRPNAAHRAVARLERSDQGLGVITQNIDGLHQEAGARTVVEVHGTAPGTMLMTCSWVKPMPTPYGALIGLPLSRSMVQLLMRIGAPLGASP